MIGMDIIFKFIFRQLTIDDVIKRVADKLGLKGRAIVCPYPEIGMDVDKPHQLEIMRADLARHPRSSASTGKSPSKSKTAMKPAAKAKSRPAKRPAAGKIKAKAKAASKAKR